MKASLLHRVYDIVFFTNSYLQKCCTLGLNFSCKISLKKNMLQNLKNFFKLCQILKARGNWPLIRYSKKQLWNFFICKNGLVQKPFFSAMIYWFHMLKGLDILVWRLETFGFLFSQKLNKHDREYINEYIK